MCANNDEEDFENSEVSADVQEITVDSEGCAQGARLEFLEDIGGLPLETLHANSRARRIWYRSKLAKLPSDLDGLPARECDEDDEQDASFFSAACVRRGNLRSGPDAKSPACRRQQALNLNARRSIAEKKRGLCWRQVCKSSHAPDRNSCGGCREGVYL